MKKKTLLASLLTIVLCISIIAGSTFALFTDETKFNIAVTSGDVEIFASAEVSAIYSAKAIKEAYTGDPDDLFRDENGAFYIHEEQTDTFLNGGTAEVVNGTVVISRITPGDKVDINVEIANTSDVAISYRYKIVSNNTNLATGMKVTTFNKDGSKTATEALAIWVSDWYSADAPAGVAEAIPTRTISVELPVYAGNEYQTEKAGNQYYDEDGNEHYYTEDIIQSVTYTLIVEAVQGNANTNNEEKFVVYEDKAIKEVTPELNDTFFATPTNCAYIHDVYLQGEANIAVDQNVPFALENVTTDVDGSVIIVDDYAPAILISNCDFWLDAGECIIDASDYQGGIYQVFIENITINGELVPVGGNIDQYLKNVHWYYVSDPNIET